MIEEKNPLIFFLERFGRPGSTGVNSINSHQVVKILDFPLLRVQQMEHPVTERQFLRPCRKASKFFFSKHYSTGCNEVFLQNIFKPKLGAVAQDCPIVLFMFIRKQLIFSQNGRPPKTSGKIRIVPQKFCLFLQLMRINPIIVCFTKSDIFPFRFLENKGDPNSLPC